ncbi:hypothetical protein ACLOJK_025138 [Asimina triloba]
MVSASGKVTLRVVLLTLFLVAAIYVGRPLYWKLSATIREIRQNRQIVQQGISDFVREARKLGWGSNRRILELDHHEKGNHDHRSR